MAMDFQVTYEDEGEKEPVFTAGQSNPTVIKVIGCGGCGGNAVNNMVDAGIQGVEFIAMNTDLQHLSISKADYKLQIGKKITGGLGAGMHPEIGEEAANEESETIKKLLQDTDMVFITAGMGGGTGTGSAPVVAKIAKELGILTVAVVTTPFDFEGEARAKCAMEGIRKLREEVDSLIVIPNQRVFDTSEKRLPVTEGFKIIDDILRQGVEGISNIITKIGIVNRDFKDVETVMKGQGDAILGIGVAEGENRGIDAATMAINNKLLSDTHIDGAKRVLIKISGNETVTLDECVEIANDIRASAAKDAIVLWGLYSEPELGDKISVTVIATGFNSPNAKIQPSEEETAVEEESASGDGSVISPGAFIDVLNGKNLPPAGSGRGFEKSASENPLPWGQTKTAEKSSAAKIVESTGSGFHQGENQKNAGHSQKSSGLVPPPDFVNTNDWNQPAVWRKGFSKSIDLTKK